MAEHPKSKSTGGFNQPDGSPRRQPPVETCLLTAKHYGQVWSHSQNVSIKLRPSLSEPHDGVDRGLRGDVLGVVEQRGRLRRRHRGARTEEARLAGSRHPAIAVGF